LHERVQDLGNSNSANKIHDDILHSRRTQASPHSVYPNRAIKKVILEMGVSWVEMG
jgi:hypothetical protein